VNQPVQERDADFKTKIEAIKGGLTGLSLDINFNVSGKKATLSDEDYVAITRLWNTIQLRRPAGDEDRMAAFEERFFPSEVETVTHALGMQLSKGMALYSPQRDLYLGASRTPTACTTSRASPPSSGPGRRARRR
jgi:hypothetical protein